MKRNAIIGSGGAGKSTMARTLGQALMRDVYGFPVTFVYVPSSQKIYSVPEQKQAGHGAGL